MPGQPFDRAGSGEAHDVPIVTGSNADEMTLFTLTTPIPTAAAYERLVRAVLGDTPLADEVLAIYPASDFDTPKDAYVALTSDVAFICSSLAFAEAAALFDDPFSLAAEIREGRCEELTRLGLVPSP
jgi:para-nitrobenzyl esterase